MPAPRALLLLLPLVLQQPHGASASASASASAASPPHIVYALIDDFGWANAGWHRSSPDPSTVTPNLDALVAEGIELDRFYAHKFCGPSRAALQTGRLPIHVTILDDNLADYNPKDPVSGFQGIPRNMTAIAAKLKTSGYSTAIAGKWHAQVP